MVDKLFANFEIISISSCENRSQDSVNTYQIKIETNSSEIKLSNQFNYLIQLFDLMFLSIPLLAAFLNLTSWMVFIKWKKNPMRSLLLFLSLSEIVLNSSYASFSVLEASFSMNYFKFKNSFVATLLWLILATEWALTNSSIIMRNWAVVLIAFARWEAIKYPLKPGKICEGKQLKVILIVLSSISVLYAMIRMREINLVFCLDTGQIQLEYAVLNEISTRIVLNFGFLILQGLCPVLLVLIFSIFLIYQIRMWNRQTKSSLVGSLEIPMEARVPYKNRGRQSILSGSSFTRRFSEEFRNSSVLALSATFFALETPQCLMMTLLNNGILSEHIGHIGLQITHRLLFVDSLSNFLIYVASSKKYRKSLKNIVFLSNFLKHPTPHLLHTARVNSLEGHPGTQAEQILTITQTDS